MKTNFRNTIFSEIKRKTPECATRFHSARFDSVYKIDHKKFPANEKFIHITPMTLIQILPVNCWQLAGVLTDIVVVVVAVVVSIVTQCNFRHYLHLKI